MKDKELILAIKNGNREEAIKFLYLEYPKIHALILKAGCNKVIAKEIFNDSLLILIENVQKPSFHLSSALSTYLYGINRFLVKNELRKQNKFVELEWSDTLIVSEADLGFEIEKEERLKTMQRILGQLSDQCQKIFQLFYFEKKSMTEIADALKYSSVNSAKTQKYKCLEKAQILFKKNHSEELTA